MSRFCGCLIKELKTILLNEILGLLLSNFSSILSIQIINVNCISRSFCEPNNAQTQNYETDSLISETHSVRLSKLF